MQIGDTVQILQHDLAVVHANQDPVPRVHWVYAIVLEVLKNDAGEATAAMVEISHPGNFQHGQRMVVARKEIRTAEDLQALHDAHPHRNVERPSYENPEHKELINLRAALARCAPAVLMLLAFLLLPFGASAQTTYTQTAPMLCRSGELNCVQMGLKDDTGTVVGNYTTLCNTNALNNFTCSFRIVLGVESDGKITEVDTYFPTYKQKSGPFAYKWKATDSSGVTITGSAEGQGHWETCPSPRGGGQCAVIDSSTVTVN